MKISYAWILNFLLHFLFFIFICGFQTTFWYQLFGSVPSPLLWILPPVYLLVSRPSASAVFITYFFTYVASRSSSVPIGTLMLVIALISAAILLIRSRIYWQGSSYFLLIANGAIVAFHVFFFLISLIIEPNSTALIPLDRLTQVILSLGFCFPVYIVLRKIDRMVLIQEGFSMGKSR